ncbi:MAG: CAP domain-containing protein [Thermodesulfovibrionales bacterium]
MRLIYCIFAVLIALSSWSADAQERDSYSSLSESGSDERLLLDLVNKARMQGARCGNRYYEPAEPFFWNGKLAKAARRQCRDMSRNRFLGHRGSDGSRHSDRVSEAGYDWSSCGENICEGYETPEDVVEGWMESEGHCKNIMNPEYREAGVARSLGRGKRLYWTIVFGTAMQ